VFSIQKYVFQSEALCGTRVCSVLCFISILVQKLILAVVFKIFVLAFLAVNFFYIIVVFSAYRILVFI